MFGADELGRSWDQGAISAEDVTNIQQSVDHSFQKVDLKQFVQDLPRLRERSSDPAVADPGRPQDVTVASLRTSEVSVRASSTCRRGLE